jgi:two-component system response regulator
MNEKVILLAEDDLGHVALFERALDNCGIPCRVDVVFDGTEALDYLFSTGAYRDGDPHDVPDLIFLDLKMPKMNGLQVLQVLRNIRGEDRLRSAPVVVLTSSDLDSDIAEAYRLGAQSYVCKPLDYLEFAEAVRQTAHYWLGLNRPMPIPRAGLHFAHDGP